MQGDDVVWSRRLADELWSGVVTPLTFSLLADVMAEHMVRRRLVHAGYEGLAEQPVFRLERGYVYVNASLVAAVMRELPHAVVSDGLLELLPTRLRGGVRASTRSTFSPRVLATIASLTLRERGWMPWSRAHAFRLEAERVSLEFARLEPGGALGPAEIARDIEKLRDRLGDYLEVVSWGMIYAYVFFYLTSELLERWGGGKRMSSLLAGATGIRTFEVHAELRACAEAVKHDGALLDALMSGSSADVAERCLAGEHEFLGRSIRELLEHHGHRLTARDLAHPTWRERPAALVEVLRVLVAAREDTRGRSGLREGGAAEEALVQIGSGPFGRARLEVFSRCLAWCRDYYALRENMRYHADLFLARLRELALRAGDLLLARGALSAADDVFYLTADELSNALVADGPGFDADALRDRVDARRKRYDEHRGAAPPDVLVGDLPEPASEDPRLERRSLQGVGVSPGRVVGPARVVRNLADLEAVRPGEVIVTASTDPSWTSLLSLGRGLVLEMGGMLSHGAIVARELGIPAVADVAYATALVRTGDRITVDGGSGEVAVVDG